MVATQIMILTTSIITLFVFFFTTWIVNYTWKKGIKRGMERGVPIGVEKGIPIGIKRGIAIGKDQILKENEIRVDHSRMTDGVYHQTLMDHLPQLGDKN